MSTEYRQHLQCQSGGMATQPPAERYIPVRLRGLALINSVLINSVMVLDVAFAAYLQSFCSWFVENAKENRNRAATKKPTNCFIDKEV